MPYRYDGALISVKDGLDTRFIDDDPGCFPAEIHETE